MATAAAPTVPLAERVDVHKSCKSLETILSVFSDYCEAASSVVTLQKKLVKALREAAGLKITNDIAANTLNTSAALFEALHEIDTKFAKVVDKEYDGISNEVKKWFKKLAKEEKAHDEKVSSANNRIKQAGMMYEKKSKKSARDAAEEHARYINLISTVGPEINQEKYNHVLSVTQRHAETTYSVAACISRVADAEWMRSCEGVRKFSPMVGPLGEWRAFCEGGWIGPVPQDLPDIQEEPTVPSNATLLNSTPIGPSSDARGPQEAVEQNNRQTSVPDQSTNLPLPFPQPSVAARSPSRQQSSAQTTAPPSSFEPPRQLVDDNTGSVRSLSAFPSPPTHFPLPPARLQAVPSYQSPRYEPTAVPAVSPIEDQSEQKLADEQAASTVPSSDEPKSKEGSGGLESHASDKSLSSTEARDKPQIVAGQPSAGAASTPRVNSLVVSTATTQKGEHFDRRDNNKERARSVDLNGLDRSDSNGSIVAAMRDRYANMPQSSSPLPRDLPRLPLSVSEMATRYKSNDESPTSPRHRPASPPGPRPLPVIDQYAQAREVEASWREPSPYKGLSATNEASPSSLRSVGEERARTQQEDAARVRERELEAREQELRKREEELIRQERMKVMSSSPVEMDRRRSPTPQAIQPRERRTSLQLRRQRTKSQTDQLPPLGSPSHVRSQPRYSASSSHLAPPLSSQQHSFSSDESSGGVPGHSEICGCERCSVAKYKMSSSSSASSSPQMPYQPPTHLRPVTPEKPKGWMRRLSMPVVVTNAFSDSKHKSSPSARGLLSLDGKKGGGIRGGPSEDGRYSLGAGIGGGSGVGGRTSYEGISNRSVTSLGLKR